MRLATKIKIGAVLFAAPFAAGFLISSSRLEALEEYHQAEDRAKLIVARDRIKDLEARVMDLEMRAVKNTQAQAVQLNCMAKNIYFESGNQPYNGKLAVGSVVMNRVASNRYPSTPCEVIDQPSQFSWTKDGKSDVPDHMSRAWRDSQRAARDVLVERARVVSPAVQHYHADYVRPRWASKMNQVATIGNHIFYE